MSDPFWDKTILALRFDGAHGSSVFTDLKGHTVTQASSGITISTANSVSGGASALFTATANNYLTTTPVSDFALGLNDFSLDTHFYDTSNDASKRGIIGMYPHGNYASGAWQIHYQSSTRTFWFLANASNGYGWIAPQPLFGRWGHIAFGRKNGVLKFYFDGAEIAPSEVIGGGILPTASLVTSGFNLGGLLQGATFGLKAHLDNFRIVKGACAFDGPFTPPATFFGYRVSGTVKDTAGSLAARIVRAYNRTNGNLVGQAVSSALDGSFEIALVTPDPHYVICLDDDSGDELEALIYDRVMPVL